MNWKTLRVFQVEQELYYQHENVHQMDFAPLYLPAKFHNMFFLYKRYFFFSTKFKIAKPLHHPEDIQFNFLILILNNGTDEHWKTLLLNFKGGNQFRNPKFSCFSWILLNNEEIIRSFFRLFPLEIVALKSAVHGLSPSECLARGHSWCSNFCLESTDFFLLLTIYFPRICDCD